LENLSDDEEINRAWENIINDIKISAKRILSLHELKQHKLRFDEEGFVFLDQRKQAKMQWVQDPSRNNVDNMNNARGDVTRHCINIKEYLKSKIEEHETNCKIKKY
jgi:hypothetical protein